MNFGSKTLFDTVLLIIIPVLGGFYAEKRGMFGEDFSKKLSGFVLGIAQPFMILASILGTEYSEENLASGLKVLLAAAITHLIAAVIAFLVTFRFKDQRNRRVSEFCMVFSNCGFFGFPILHAVYGNIGVFWGGFYLIIFNLFSWSYGVFVLSRANPDLKLKPIKMLLNPGSIPCIIGFLMYILRINVYTPIYNSMKILGDTCTPLSMVIIGAMIATLPIKQLLATPSSYLACLIRLFILPAASAAALMLLGFGRDISFFGSLMMSLPCATSSVMFAKTYDIRSDVAAVCVGLSTLLSIATVPLVMGLIGSVINNM